MKSVIEVSVSGKIFLFDNDLTPTQLDKITNIANIFYENRRNLCSKSDYDILQDFEVLVQESLSITLTRINIESVIVIK